MKNFIRLFKCTNLDKRTELAHEFRSLFEKPGREIHKEEFFYRSFLTEEIFYPSGIEAIPEKEYKVDAKCNKQLVHSIAHIEYNAKTIYADTIVRFMDQINDEEMILEFLKDFSKVVSEEALHFMLLNNRLKDLGSFYGDYQIHNKLWLNCLKTKNDFIARVAVISLVQESRGLDVGPKLIHKLTSMNDSQSAKIIKRIVNDEVGHVRTGVKWFKILCDLHGVKDYADKFKQVCTDYLSSPPFPPFNKALRNKAALPENWYKF